MTNILPENNVGNNSTAYTPIVDSVSEFNVQTSVLPAECGRFSGGVINMVTKTGTNQLHGGAFAFAQTTALGAKNYFSSGPVPAYYQYQWGGTLGGPIVILHVFNGHNRTFFFVGYQDTIEADDKKKKKKKKKNGGGFTAGSFGRRPGRHLRSCDRNAGN